MVLIILLRVLTGLNMIVVLLGGLELLTGERLGANPDRLLYVSGAVGGCFTLALVCACVAEIIRLLRKIAGEGRQSPPSIPVAKDAS